MELFYYGFFDGGGRWIFDHGRHGRHGIYGTCLMKRNFAWVDAPRLRGVYHESALIFTNECTMKLMNFGRLGACSYTFPFSLSPFSSPLSHLSRRKGAKGIMEVRPIRVAVRKLHFLCRMAKRRVKQ